MSAQHNGELTTSGYRIVKLASGAYSVHSLAEGETFHPVIGPVAEAQALYVKQARLRERLKEQPGSFVIWDVGLGAAANAVAILGAARECPCSVHLLSFDHTLAPLEFALAHTQHLQYLCGYEAHLKALLSDRGVSFRDGDCQVGWQVHQADFPAFLASAKAESLPKPHLIMFDAFSPARNPAMWTLPVFTRLFELLDPNRPCALPTYSRSTILRVTLLLAGFFVGVGHATGEKEETTFAANHLEMIKEPLDGRWLQRAQRSNSAEPMTEPIYRQVRLSARTWDRLRSHPQFASLASAGNKLSS